MPPPDERADEDGLLARVRARDADALGEFLVARRPQLMAFLDRRLGTGLRRKIEPAAGGDQPPVSLDDMPTDFTLVFSPSLLIAVHPSATDNPWRWLQFTVREWWHWLKTWIRRLATGQEPPVQPVLRLTLTPHHAQSVAWSVTDGMPFLVRRTPPAL